jgi:toxin CptA
MHSAPSVSYPVGRSRMARRLLLGIWCLGAAGLAAWCLQFSGAGWRTALLVLVVLAAGLSAWRAARLGEGVELQWNGQHWSCAGSAQCAAARVSIHLDFQPLMLVRLCEPGRATTWLWLERGSMPSRWLDLRRALHATESIGQAPREGVPQP